MQRNQQQDIIDLFTSSALSFFQAGGVEELLANRNKNIGSLLKAERSSPYLAILYRMLLFKREYELEPLYDDIYRAVEDVLSATEAGYDQQRFRMDMEQLSQWELLSFRIEKQRLRGYRDNRKRKFRYRLSDEAIHFLEWLEQRFVDDFQNSSNDTRDLLGEMRGTLGELLRLLHTVRSGATDDAEEETELSRRILFQIFKANDLCQEITTNLADFNGGLLLFLAKRYAIDEVRQLVKEVDRYVETFLKQAHGLSREIVPLLERLRQDKNLRKLSRCSELMEEERLRTPNLLQTRRDANLMAIPEHLQSFFSEQGGLEHLLHRINSSSLHVWQKLRSHLRELERKNNKLQDIGARIQEMARLPVDQPTTLFFSQLFAQPLASFDSNYWDQYEKADAPQPRKRLTKKSTFPKQYLTAKVAGDKPVQSMDEARLEMLRKWLEKNFTSEGEQGGTLSAAHFTRFDDAVKIMELAGAGLLAGGKRLGRIGGSLSTEEYAVLVQIGERSLRCPELTIQLNKQAD
jgi:hypothetical protein